MKKSLFAVITCLMAVVTMTSCSSATPDAGQEGVFVAKGILWGQGVNKKPATTGREYCWWTTDVVYVTMTPVAYNEAIDDALSSNNSPLDFAPVI